MKRIFGFGKNKHNGHHEPASDAPGNSKKEVHAARVVQPQTPVYLQQAPQQPVPPVAARKTQPASRVAAPVSTPVSEEDEFAEFDAMMAEVKKTSAEIKKIGAEREQIGREREQIQRDIRELDRQALEVNDKKLGLLNQQSKVAVERGQTLAARVRQREQNMPLAGKVF